MQTQTTTDKSDPIIRSVVPKDAGFGHYFDYVGVIAIHVFTVIALVRGPTLRLVALAAGFYFLRMFAITAVYHRYFAHRTYKTSRALQLILAVLGTTATQKGPLWWASTHRIHHKYSDTPRDVHSPMRRGFWYSHMGWWLGREHETTDLALIPDFASYPELRWLERYHALSPLAMIGLLAVFGGYDVVLWGYVVSTCALMHGTFTINSLAHVFGSRRFATTDTSRNNFALAILTMGEGWHNNHHHYQSSANQGFYWWEIDMSFYILRALEKLGLIWDVRVAPAHVLKRNLIADEGERCPLLLGPLLGSPAGDVDAPPAPPEPAAASLRS